MAALIQQLQSNWLPLLGFLLAWLIYRLGKADERRGLIRGIREELRLHALWVGNSYPPPVAIPPAWQEPTYMVHKLGTVAIDNGISRGPALFLNSRLVTALVGYRQALSHLNQSIDSAMGIQANAELWEPSPHPQLLQRMTELTTAIHVFAIGTEDSGAAYQRFRLLQDEVQTEADTKLLPILWMVTGINLLLIKRWLLRYL